MPLFRRREDPSIEVQLAPMADIGFLLMCFFIISSKPPRYEADLGMTLPGAVSDEISMDMPEEVRVGIMADGTVEVNESVVGLTGDHEMKPLQDLLVKFKESADLNQSKALVTVDADNATTHQRVVDVLNACGHAGITGVTIGDDTGEEEF
jgi:biopolymer transport protein ExbD